MKQWTMALALAGVAFLACAEARAIELGTPATEHPFRSRQNFAFELRFSPYRPQIDSDPALTSTRGQALRDLLYLFERDEAIRLLRAG